MYILWGLMLHLYLVNGTELTETALILKVSETAAYKNQQSFIESTYSKTEMTKAQYQPQLEGQVGYGESKEEPLFAFSPIISPARNSSIGISQKTPIGVTAKIEAFSDQISIPAFNVNRANRTGARLNLEVDLLSNFLGRRDLSELKNTKIKKKVADLQSRLNTHGIIQDFRKAYWSYMGLAESHIIAEELLKSSQKMFSEVQSRQKVGAADKGDYARAQAQLSNRQTQMSVIEYQKEQIFQQLKIQYPDLTGIPYQSTLNALQEVQDCIDKIIKEKEFQTTSEFTNIAALLEEEKSLSVKQANTISDWNVKLKGQYQQNAVGQGFEESRQFFFDQPRDAFQVALQVSVPLGSSLSKAEKHTVNQVVYGYESQIGTLRQTVNTQHKRALNSLALLGSAVQTQELSVKSLRESAKTARQKYAQARISQIEFILEQDKLFGTEVESVQNRLLIINETLDYLKTFNQQRCRFNKTAEV